VRVDPLATENPALAEEEARLGSEIESLERAFIYAGAPSVIATLWSVEDAATKDLMVAFYRYLDKGYTKGEALRQAQIDVLRDPGTAHPYYWAGFVLTGDAGEPGPGPTETPTPIQATPTSTPSGDDGTGGGLCRCAALPVALVVLVGVLGRTRRYGPGGGG
jgi:hypothetical protein